LLLTHDEERNLPLQEQSEPKLPRNELVLIKKLPSQIKEIIEQSARIEHQLQGMNKEIKQIMQTHPDKAESRESIKQIESQIAELQTHVTSIENAVNNALANIKSKKKARNTRSNDSDQPKKVLFDLDLYLLRHGDAGKGMAVAAGNEALFKR
jgi:chromosome segregation ATPase